MLEDLFDLIEPVLCVLLIGALLIGCTGLFFHKVSEYTCEAKATSQNMKYDFGLFKGCMVKTEHGWMDYNRLIYKKDVE